MDGWAGLYDGFERRAEFEAFLVLFALLAKFAVVLPRSPSAFGVGTAAYRAEVVWAWELAVGVGSLGCSLSIRAFFLMVFGCRCGRWLAGGREEYLIWGF